MASVEALAEGKAVGWFQGRMEFGPRALWAADSSWLMPAHPDAVPSESEGQVSRVFPTVRPFVLREYVSEWFDLAEDSPYMLLVANVVEARQRPQRADHDGLFGIDKLPLSGRKFPQ